MNTQGKVEIEAAEHASTPTQQSYKRTCGPAERRSPSNLLRPACSRQSAWESRAARAHVHGEVALARDEWLLLQ